MTARHRFSICLAVSAALMLPVAGFAQTTPPPAHAAKAGHDSADLVEQHIARLHAQLKITSAQQPQWDQFTQVMRDNARDMQQAFSQRGTRLASMNAAENMQSYAAVAEQHAQAMQRLSAAFQTLYATMSDDQKATADGVFRALPGPGHAKI